MPELHRKATWNPERDLWETDQTVLLSEHSAAYSETLPPSGMTRNGVLYERPTSGRRTSAPGCLCLPTPTTNLGDNGGSQDPEKRRAGGHSVSLQDVAEHRLLPTPAAGNFNDGEDVAAWDARRAKVKKATGNGNGMGEPLAIAAKRMAEALLPTPTAADGNGARNATANRSPGSTASSGMTLSDVAYAELFGDYDPAIRRWEQITGHPAPPPTKPTGRNGEHRLSARFAEWMMGLEPGWVTDIPISRTEQLRAIGNGVVPRQAVVALVDMKQHFESRLVRGSSTQEEEA